MFSNFPATKAFGAASFGAPFATVVTSSTKGLEAIAAETTDYAKASFEKRQAFFEKLIGVKKIDEAIQHQSDFTKSAYDDFLAYATKIGETYSSSPRKRSSRSMARRPHSRRSSRPRQ